MSDRSFIPPSGANYSVKKSAGGQLEVSTSEKDGEKYSVAPESARIDHQTQRVVWGKSASERNIYWVYESRGKRVLSWPGGSMELEASDLTEAAGSGGGKLKPLKLTMPGKVVAVHVKQGDVVDADQKLLVVEAMKMENLLLAPARARIGKLHVNAGDRLDSGALLITFEAAD